MRRPLAVARPARAIRTHHGARRLGMRRRRRTSRRLLPAAQASTRSIAAHARLAVWLRPPGDDPADTSATEADHTDHETAAGANGNPLANGGKLVSQPHV